MGSRRTKQLLTEGVHERLDNQEPQTSVRPRNFGLLLRECVTRKVPHLLLPFDHWLLASQSLEEKSGRDSARVFAGRERHHRARKTVLQNRAVGAIDSILGVSHFLVR